MFAHSDFVSFRSLAVSVFFLLSVSQAARGELLFDDGFDSSISNWTNVSAGDNKNWTRDKGGTPSSGTGPSTGADGSLYYMYLETSAGSAYYAGDTAILLGPPVSHHNIRLEFKYHMYGSNTGTLAVDVLSGGSWINDVWSVSGQQHTSNYSSYTAAAVDLGSYDVTQIRIRATAAGGYRGDIAIDSAKIWGEVGGPVAPEFSDDTLVRPDAVQEQPYIDSIADDASDANGDQLYFSKISGPAWLSVDSAGEIYGTPTGADVGLNTFVVEVSDGALADTATLNVTVLDNTLPIVLSSTDFETGTGDWSNVTAGDNRNWLRDSGGTPSSGTGPSRGGNASLYYLYLETSSGSAYYAGDTAILESPDVTGSNIHLNFQYHMYGSDIGTLAVDVLANGSWINDVWSLSGQQQTSNTASYNVADLDLSAYAVSKVRFRATAAGGFRGDIALDNVELLSVPAVPSEPVAPVFLTDPITKSSAAVNVVYADSLAADATDENGDALTFSRVNGPAWLTVAPDGTLSGQPGVNDIGQNSFVVSVSDGVYFSMAMLNITVTDAPVFASLRPEAAGHGQDGGANFGWVTDGVIDEFWDRMAYQDDVVVRRYTSFDFTKRSNYWGVFEFRLSQAIIDNAANVIIHSAILELDTDGSTSGTIDFHGYPGNGSIELADFSQNNLLVGSVAGAPKLTVDVTTYLRTLVGQSSYAGFLLKPWDVSADMYMALWNGTPHPAYGDISGQNARLKINYVIQ